MPAFVTHELFGKELFQRFPPEIKALLNRNPAPYFWGLQGPDLLFYRGAIRGKNHLPKYGNIMHSQNIDELFTILAGYVQSDWKTSSSYHISSLGNRKRKGDTPHRHYLRADKNDAETLLAYGIGFIGHYVLDSNTHPYVYWLQEQKAKKHPSSQPNQRRGIHHRIESDIDSILYQIYNDRSIHHYRPAPRLYGNNQEYHAVAELYRFLMMDLYGIDLQVSDMMKCFRDAKQIIKAVFDPANGGVYFLTRFCELAVGKPNTLSAHVRKGEVKEDVLNLRHIAWENLQTHSGIRRESFLELMDNAIPQGVQMACEYYYAVTEGLEFSPDGLPPFDYGAPIKQDYNPDSSEKGR